MQSHRRIGWVSFALIAVACFATYANTLGNDFVAGDIQFIQDNESIKSLSVLRTAFTHGYWWTGKSGGTYYRPLLVLLDSLDYFLWGSSPVGYHATNLLLHTATSWLVYLFIKRLLRSPFTAMGASLFFAVHPIHTHAVSYISARSAVLCTLFSVASSTAILRHQEDLKNGRTSLMRWWAVAAYVGALMSQEAGITLLALLPLLLFASSERRASWRSELPWMGAMALSTAVYFTVRNLTLGAALSQRPSMLAELPALAAILTICKTYSFYFLHLFFPLDISYVPRFLPVLDGKDASGWASLLLLLFLVAVCVAGGRRWSAERLGLGWALLTLAPVSGVVPLDHFVKGQYAYLPSVGVALVVASLMRRALRAIGPRKERRAVLVGAFVLSLVGYAGCTVLSNQQWKTSDTLFARVFEDEREIPEALFEHPIMRSTNAILASLHLLTAASYSKQQDCASASPHILRTMQLSRKRSVQRQARQLQAHCLFKSGNTEDALKAYLPLVEEDPKDPLAPARVGLLLLQKNQPKQAILFFEQACQRGWKEACQERDKLQNQSPDEHP